ncbi:1916_t:CDS:2 [Cetraspora pellucida]|uniref:1916_t:CDS:1 n=2 Tax=Cetraspora pellucida TaxID=1433469 RepID=A0ACA9K729_9GLOM|nr:1915_t:CDS:2 [Cetraspora pellucida]CAG8456566.1 1916_t:CDS:2 [Cetraspora pellucida]
MLYCLDLKLPTASKDTLFFDSDAHPICADFIIERWIYYNNGCPNSLGINKVYKIDEDSLILIEQYKGHIYCLSATPIPIPNNVKVKLKKTYNLYQVVELLMPTHQHLESNVFHYLKEYPNHKTLVIHLSYSVCVKLHNTLQNTLNRRCQILNEWHEKIYNDVKVIFATSVVKAEITISNISLVIDSGLSISKYNGVYVTRYSSHTNAI